MRSHVAAASIAVVVLWTSVAHTEGPTQAGSGSERAKSMLAPTKTLTFIPTDAIPAKSSPLGDAWAHALRAVLERMQQLLAIEPTEALTPPALPPGHTMAWQPSVSTGPERVERSLLHTGPMLIRPVTQSIADTRGEHAALLGVSFELPWEVP